MGILSIIAMLVIYLFVAQQVTDTESPRIAALVNDVLQRNLVEGTKTTLVLRSRPGREPRHYEMTLQPVERIASDERSLRTLLASAAEIVHAEVSRKSGAVFVTCVAEVPGAPTLRVTYDHHMQLSAEPESPPPAPPVTQE